MYRNRQQKAQALKILLKHVDLEHLWCKDNGPLEYAITVLNSGRLSVGEQVMLRAALDLWNGHGNCTLKQIAYHLDVNLAHMLFTLVLAIQSRERDAVEKWMEGK